MGSPWENQGYPNPSSNPYPMIYTIPQQTVTSTTVSNENLPMPVNAFTYDQNNNQTLDYQPEQQLNYDSNCNILYNYLTSGNPMGIPPSQPSGMSPIYSSSYIASSSNNNLNNNPIPQESFYEYLRHQEYQQQRPSSELAPQSQSRKSLQKKVSIPDNLREIPSWNIYFKDQRKQMSDFSITGNMIHPDEDLNKCVSICFDDICISKFAVDAVVNSTTELYSGEYGVNQILHKEAGPLLKQACLRLPRLEVGNVEITPGFLLPAKYIIHTNGPIAFQENEYANLKRCYENILNLVTFRSLRTIVFPCISTGRKGVNREVAAKIALETVRRFLEQNKSNVDRLIFSLHNAHDIVIYRRFMQVYFPIK